MSKVSDNYEAPATPEEIREELAFNEDEILRALTDQSHHEDLTKTIEVSLGAKAKFSFRIRPLSEKEWDKCRERNTKYQKNRRLGGMRLPESTDTTGYYSDLHRHRSGRSSQALGQQEALECGRRSYWNGHDRQDDSLCRKEAADYRADRTDFRLQR